MVGGMTVSTAPEAIFIAILSHPRVVRDISIRFAGLFRTQLSTLAVHGSRNFTSSQSLSVIFSSRLLSLICIFPDFFDDFSGSPLAVLAAHTNLTRGFLCSASRDPCDNIVVFYNTKIEVTP